MGSSTDEQLRLRFPVYGFGSAITGLVTYLLDFIECFTSKLSLLSSLCLSHLPMRQLQICWYAGTST